MNKNVLKRIVRDIFSFAKTNNLKKAEFTWHGGEPTMAGIKFYREVVEIQNELELEFGIKTDNNIQTNCTLINNDWIDFLKENKFSLGISLDGPKEIHDTNRFYISGKGSFKKVMHCIELIQKNGIRYGTIAVVTNASIGHAKTIIDFFIKNNIYKFDFAPCAELPGTGIKLTIEPENYANFCIEAFDHWLYYDKPDVEIRFFKQAIYGLLDANPGLCSMGGNIHCGIFPTITANGDVFFCDNYEGSEDMFLGNIMETNLTQLLSISNSRHSKIRNKIVNVKHRCSNCKWFKVCGGGCPRYSRLSVNHDFDRKNYFCSAYKRIFCHINNKINELLPNN